MTDNFPSCLEIILKHEGGYVNDPKDSGGETNWGISKRAYPHLDIKNLTKEEAGKIYYNDYWMPSRCNYMPYAVALCVFDAAVNSGVRKAAIWLQWSINDAAKRIGLKERINVDGYVGPATLSLLSRLNHEDVVLSYTTRRLGFLESLKNFVHYGRGWSKRVENVYQLAMNSLDKGDV